LMFRKILIANRGEIAVRVARTCRDLDVESVAVYSDADAGSRHVAAATESFHLPGVVPATTYLNGGAIIDAALSTGAEAVHPGYGFLAENADFAAAVVEAGLSWIGPPPAAIRATGDKITARRLARDAGVPPVPGLLDPVEGPAEVSEFASEHGYPVAIKASGGGGGRGLKVARSTEQVKAAFESARREALAYFSSSAVYVERYLEAPKHLEVQILAPTPEEPLWLGVRDCSLQRRHQKLLEETPAPRFSERLNEMGDAALRVARACGYVNAGTVEMLVEADGSFYFLEVNSRLQVEHTITEEVFGVDLVACQLLIAAGEPLGLMPGDLVARGHAIECRINAEDSAAGFAPAPGRLTDYSEPAGPGVRVDSGYGAGDDIPDAYDSLIAKVVTWGADREQARRRMLRALGEFNIEGVPTTIAAQERLLLSEEFVDGSYTTGTVENTVGDEGGGGADEDVLLVGGRPVRLWNPAMARSASAAVHTTAAAGDVVAPMQGTILEVLVEEGRRVEAGEGIVVLEAMKMETTIAAPKSGTVITVKVAPGDSTGAGELLATVE
jgi:acetyl-CoA/propionyl-CoA/long-chain acyl-CoA carboxylase, biotin carboxylase, biotin carboxyl carrier protein